MSTGPAPLPSRTKPILAIVFGTLMMIFGFIVGTAIGLMNLFGQLDLESFSSIQDGGSVTLDQNEAVSLFSEGSDSPLSNCTLMSGTEQATTSEEYGVTVYTAPVDGDYAVDCGTSEPLYVADSAFLDQMVGNVGSLGAPMLIGLAVSFLGLVLLIVGIVWLVKVNRRRNEAMRAQSFGGPYYGGGQYGGPYGGAPYGGVPGGYGQPQTPGSSADPSAAPQPSREDPSTYGSSPQNYGGQHNSPVDEPPRYGERIDPEDRA